MPGFTVLTPKQETAYNKMTQDKSLAGCGTCGGERPAYPAPVLQDVPPDAGKKNSKR